MDLRRFVGANRASWERLEALLRRGRVMGIGSLSPTELRDLGLLHRKVSTDLAAVRTAHPGSKIVNYLNDLALHSHNAVYRLQRKPWRKAVEELGRTIPASVRRHRGALQASALIFFAGSLLGLLGAALDESLATLILGQRFVERIRDGEYWVRNIFDVVPHSVASAGILTNNLSVAFAVFALGFTGLGSAVILFNNGVMLGAVVELTAQYELLTDFAPFVVTHGLLEVSGILVAGAAGFAILDGWLHPGDRTRAQGLRHGARDALRLAGGAAVALLVAAPVEAFVSPVETVPPSIRISLGVLLAAVYWIWLLKPRDTVERRPRVWWDSRTGS